MVNFNRLALLLLLVFCPLKTHGSEKQQGASGVYAQRAVSIDEIFGVWQELQEKSLSFHFVIKQDMKTRYHGTLGNEIPLSSGQIGSDGMSRELVRWELRIQDGLIDYRRDKDEGKTLGLWPDYRSVFDGKMSKAYKSPSFPGLMVWVPRTTNNCIGWTSTESSLS